MTREEILTEVKRLGLELHLEPTMRLVGSAGLKQNPELAATISANKPAIIDALYIALSFEQGLHVAGWPEDLIRLWCWAERQDTAQRLPFSDYDRKTMFAEEFGASSREFYQEIFRALRDGPPQDQTSMDVLKQKLIKLKRYCERGTDKKF